MKIDKNKLLTSKFQGVAVKTDYGLKLIAVFKNSEPTMDDILDMARIEHENELRKQHLPVQGYCTNNNKEKKRLEIVHQYQNLIANVKRGNYETAPVKLV